jgi:hypothetical protein
MKIVGNILQDKWLGQNSDGDLSNAVFECCSLGYLAEPAGE